MPDTRCRLQDAWIQDSVAGCQIPDAGCQMPDDGCRIQDSRYTRTRCWILSTPVNCFQKCCFKSLICGSAFQARYIAHSRQDAAPTIKATELKKQSSRYMISCNLLISLTGTQRANGPTGRRANGQTGSTGQPANGPNLHPKGRQP